MEKDELLLERIRKGETAAFQELVESYKKKVYFLAYDLTGTHQDAEDASQEVFVRVFRSIDRFQSRSKLSTWIYTITANACKDMNKRKKRGRMVALETMEDQEGKKMELQIEDPSGTPQNRLEEKQLASTVEVALGQLSPRERTVVVMRHYNDMMLKDIAGALHISEGTVKSLLFRGLKRLGKALGPRPCPPGGSVQ